MRVEIAGVRHHKCDWCRKDFTAEGEDHFTIEVGERSGFASLRSLLPGWRLMRKLRRQQLHFCLPIVGRDSCLDLWHRAVAEESPAEYIA